METIEALNEKIAEAERNIEQVVTNLNQLRAFKAVLTDQRATINCEFKIGDIIQGKHWTNRCYRNNKWKVISIHEEKSLFNATAHIFIKATRRKVSGDYYSKQQGLSPESFELAERKDADGKAT